MVGGRSGWSMVGGRVRWGGRWSVATSVGMVCRGRAAVVRCRATSCSVDAQARSSRGLLRVQGTVKAASRDRSNTSRVRRSAASSRSAVGTASTVRCVVLSRLDGLVRVAGSWRCCGLAAWASAGLGCAACAWWLLGWVVGGGVAGVQQGHGGVAGGLVWVWWWLVARRCPGRGARCGVQRVCWVWWCRLVGRVLGRGVQAGLWWLGYWVSAGGFPREYRVGSPMGTGDVPGWVPGEFPACAR